MIYEYALDPLLFFDWAKSKRDYSHYIRLFGVGTPRFLSSFPKNKPAKWRSYVLSNAPENLSEVERLRVVELLLALSDKRVEREGYSFVDGKWIDGAVAEHTRVPFEGIFAKEKPANPVAACFTADDTHGGSYDVWDKKHMLTPARTANALADAVANLLRLSQQIVIVDPYGYKGSAIKSFDAFIQRMMINRVGAAKPQLTILFDGSKARESFVYEKLVQHTQGFDLHVMGIKEKPDGEKLHNRYILTELGGVSFGIGTDEGEAHHTDDLVLLDCETYLKRWDQYVVNSVFDRAEMTP
jgi:hypothetical protein